MRRVKIVEAVPGSGKTRSIKTEIDSEIEKGADPEKITIVTFTRSAAEEIGSRIENPKVSASTIHSLSYRILQETNYPGLNELSYSQLLDLATSTVRTEEFKSSHRYDMFAIDEAQDLTHQQYSLLSSLSELSGYTYVVGDRNQSIYSFNGSDPDIMLKFGKGAEAYSERMVRSYRIPSNVASYVNSMFSLEPEIVPTGDSGRCKFHQSEKAKLYNDAASLVRDKTDQAVLMRTNREVINFVKRNDMKGRIAATLPAGMHPYISMMHTISRLEEGIYPNELLSLSWMTGGFSWATNLALKTMPPVRLTRSQLDTMYNPGTHSYAKNDLPPVLTGSRSQIYSLLQELDNYSSFYHARSKDDLYLLFDMLRTTAYNVEQFWKNIRLSDEEIVEMAQTRIQTEQEQYFRTDYETENECMTMHSAKGREFDSVITVINGWSVNIYSPEEFRVLYVACTRARKELDIVSPKDIKRSKDKINIIDSLDNERDIL